MSIAPNGVEPRELFIYWLELLILRLKYKGYLRFPYEPYGVNDDAKMKGKIIIGMFAILIIGLLIISGCSFESPPNKEPFRNSKIKCEDGRIVPISEGCDAGVPDEKPEQVYTIDDFASECMAGNYEIYAEVMEKYKGGDCECPEGALCGVCIPFDRLVLGDDFARDEFNMLDEQDRLIWESLSVGESYLFVVKDGKIISAEKGRTGRKLMEHKKRCSLGPAYYRGVVTDFYVCESAGEGVVYKCEEPDYATLKSSGEELKITNIDKGALRKLVIGWEYVFTFEDGVFVDAVNVDGESEVGNLK